MMSFLKKDWVPYIFYSLLALAILGYLLAPGYILTLDLSFSPTPHYTPYFWGLSEWSTSIYAAGIASSPLFCLIQLLSKIIPAWVIEKFILLLLLFLSGWGAHKLISTKSIGCYFVGIFYMINPFVYVRFMAGQWGVLWAYAWMPLAIGAFLQLLRDGCWKNVVKMAIMATIAGIVQVQGFILLFLACLIILVFKLIRESRTSTRVFQLLKWTMATAGVFFVLNLYWLFPFLTSAETTLGQLNHADQLSFIPRFTSDVGILFNVVSLHGFWRDGYIYAKDILPFWWILFILILFFAIYGFTNNMFFSQRSFRLKHNEAEISPESDNAGNKYLSEQLWIVLSFAVIGITGFILALGIATEYTRPFNEWLWNKVDMFKIFRDSHKFVGLLCLSYAFLGGLGINEVANALKQQKQRLKRTGLIILIALALATPLAYSFTMFGLYGQIGVTDYPEEWYEVNDCLNKDRDDVNVLFLPWHMYMDYQWLPNRDKRLINPSQQFFDKPVIAGDNVELPGIYSQSYNPISKYIEFLLLHRNEINNLGELLAPLNVKYVILVSEADYLYYDFLYGQEDLQVELQKSGITLFVNEHPTARIYGVDSVKQIDSLDDYLELSKQQEVTDHLYIIGDISGEDGNRQMDVLDYVEMSPVKYQVEGTPYQYTVLTVSQNVNTEHWEYNGQAPVLQNLGFMPAFKSSSDGGEITYTRFYRVYLPCYIISGATFGLMLFICFRSRQK